jgi:hypothetical protein
MRLTVYVVEFDGLPIHHFATRAEALTCARAGVSGTIDRDLDLSVVRHETVDLKPRRLAALLLNGEGWAASSVVTDRIKVRSSP